MGFAKLGSEIFVNTTTAGEQYDSSVVQLTGGGIVVAWTDANGSAVNVRGQILDTDGATRDGAEFMLNTELEGDQFGAALTATGDGGFAAGWISGADLSPGFNLTWEMASGGIQEHVVRQKFGADGGKSGGEDMLFVSQDDYIYGLSFDFIGVPAVKLEYFVQSDVALTADLNDAGGYFTTTAAEEVRAGYSWTEVPFFPVLSQTNFKAGQNGILQDGGWSRSSPAGVIQLPDLQEDLITRDVNTASLIFPVSEIGVLDRFLDPKAITLQDGAVATVFSREDNASALGGVFISHPDIASPISAGTDAGAKPDICELGNGDLVAVWRDESGSDTEIRGQRLTSGGTKIGGEFVVDPGTHGFSAPAIAALADGRFAVVWEDSSGDSSGSALKARIYTEDAEALGDAFVVNTVTMDDQTAPAVAALKNGDFIVTWTSEDGATSDIKSQVIDPQTYTGAAVAEVFHGGSLDDHVEGLDGDDEIHGGAGDDTLYGGGDNDTLYGQADDDYLSGGIGDDEMHGGGGNDTFVVVDTGDSVFEAFDNGFDTVQTTIDFTLPDNVENLSGVSFFNDLALTGNGLVNTVTGGIYDDTISGLAGDDTLDGGYGDDTLHGGTGYDHLDGGEGGDRMEGGSNGDSYFVDSAGDEVIEAAGFVGLGFDFVSSTIDYTLGDHVERLGLEGEGNLDGYGNALSNYILGNSGDNDLEGLDGSDKLYGFDGHDRLYGGDHNDTLYGGDIDDDLFGEDGADMLLGGTGADELDGGTGADIMWGGAESDVYLADDAGDRVIEFANEGDADIVISSASIVLSPNVEHLILAGTANLFGTGNTRDNLMLGNAGKNILTGAAGDDSLSGDDGADVLWGGSGGDTLDGGEGLDTASYGLSSAYVYVELVSGLIFNGDAQGDTLTGIENLSGSAHNDVLVGDAGVNRLLGNNGNDSLVGLEGGDLIAGGKGIDTAAYASSFEAVTIDLAANLVSGGDANGDILSSIENLIGSDFFDVLTGNAETNVLSGLDGRDLISGGAGDDELSGGGEIDELQGGGGADVLDGGDGDDTASYVFAPGAVTMALDGSVAGAGDAAGDTFIDVENIDGSNLAGEGDLLHGDDGVNIVFAFAGADTVNGRGGNDRLVGGYQADMMTGELGDDEFLYYATNEGGDFITDFSGVAGNDDLFKFRAAAFGGGLAAGVPLAADQFEANAAGLATLATTRFVYDTDDEILRFDVDGSGATAAQAVATLQDGASVAIADLVMF
jgi:Ca2+-binding RTX toxin-like protein